MKFVYLLIFSSKSNRNRIVMNKTVVQQRVFNFINKVKSFITEMDRIESAFSLRDYFIVQYSSMKIFFQSFQAILKFYLKIKILSFYICLQFVFILDLEWKLI